ncbi:N-acetyl sugar amidotransferase [Maridesulfovibrio sp.]|uniref:N-acetyl sugar amidotransferase n=1 Tax=Maridesulfovibrio sp. TaxID=2795000 RepID=UPI0029C9EAC6|nr:N-acetyl sugar amidotransferase [Maridesulfovibrio sp.]
MQNRETKKRFNLPDEIKFCKRCTMSNQRPRITFDDEGICSACRFAEYKNFVVDWDERDKELRALCDKHRSKDGSYDVVVPSSGGKDSGFVAHKLKEEYGMHPLTVTWAPALWTDDGMRNYENHIVDGGLDNVMAKPSGITHKLLTKLSFELQGDPFMPFNYGQYNMPLRTAVERKIPLIMYGENSEVEYGGSMKHAYHPDVPIKDIELMNWHGFTIDVLKKYGLKESDLQIYRRPTQKDIDKVGVQIHYMGYFTKWIPQVNYYYCAENTGFIPYYKRSEGTYSKYASIDDRLDGFHYYLMYIKFGIGRATSDSAHEVRDGHITREEAAGLVKRFDGEFPWDNYQTFLNYCDINDEFFWKVVDSWRSPHIWDKKDGKWALKKAVWHEEALKEAAEPAPKIKACKITK